MSRLGTETGCAVPKSGRPPRSGAVGRVETGASKAGVEQRLPPCAVLGGHRRGRGRWGQASPSRQRKASHRACQCQSAWQVHKDTARALLPSGTGLGARGGSAQTVAPRCVMAGAGATAGDPLMFQLIPLFVASTIAVTCRSDGNHTATCAQNKCETVGRTEICTQCKTGGVPVGGFCWPPGSPQAAAAGCTKEDGTALDKTATTCEKCGDGYFLFMGGCYSTENTPGNIMCKKAAGGICTALSENGRYFLVPGATSQQSVLACSNPLGTLVGTGDTAKAYVGVDGCSQCTAPVALTTAGMAAAVCTSCDNSKVPNKDGSGCFPCAVSGCSHCNRDDMCEACSSGKVSPGRKSCVDGCPSNSTDDNSVCTCNDGYSPDDAGASCVSSGANRGGLSTGAIAGISVAVVVVVGGLVGFLCWWFVCRGKA